MARGSSPTAEQVQRAKLTLAKSSLSDKKGKNVKKVMKKTEQVDAQVATVDVTAKLMEKWGKENKKAKVKPERVVSISTVAVRRPDVMHLLQQHDQS